MTDTRSGPTGWKGSLELPNYPGFFWKDWRSTIRHLSEGARHGAADKVELLYPSASAKRMFWTE